MSFGKKILSAFVDIDDTENKDKATGNHPTEQKVPVTSQNPAPTISSDSIEKFRSYFEKLIADSNLPGPDYFEFFKMVDAMKSITDEKARFATAFAGLSVQGLDKTQLINSAEKYIGILNSDAQNFNSTVDNTIKDKIEAKKKEIESSQQRITEMQNEIRDLENKIRLLTGQIKEDDEKLNNSTAGYNSEYGNMVNKIKQDIEKIKQYI
jgi:peptidoglycan hydrolase CwlO-like protein